ncbi:hypothetical protein [Nocardia australiensis]|uniref:hypothetical protein n=1 Tax=Nocardia australiensis TaxID=2887191 RepID=UPI001D140E7A|nr:hypothetical protein [Nocardia australiensis]
MSSTAKSTTPGRRLARVAVAGAFVAVPLAALAVPASADSAANGPAITEVRHHPRNHDRNDDWNCDRRGPQDDWNHSDGRWDDCDRGRWHDPRGFPRHLLPHGLFGSS